jgi:hypothetical protein
MSKTEYAAAAYEKWAAWRESGKEPSHDRAMKIVQRELGKTNGLGVEYAVPCDDGRPDDRLSFIVWDLTENGRGALDYDKQDGFIKNLLEQARMIVSGVYARDSVKIGGRWSSYPRTMQTPNRGRVRITDTTAEEREMEAERMIRVAKGMILRWKGVAGIDWKFIRSVLLRLAREVRKEWKIA